MKIGRYQRHSLIDWFPSEQVKNSHFAVIGCGAVGNEVAKNLALLGVGNVDLFDFDMIEIHNLTRSVLFRETDVGRSKADVAAERLKELDPNINANGYVGDFWDLISFSKAKSYDCLICCVDNFEARIKANMLCLITRTNFINTGIDSRFAQIEIFPFGAAHDMACYECNLPSSSYERMQKRYSCGWLKKVSYFEKKIPTTIITSSITGAIASSNALDLLKTNTDLRPRRVLIDSFTGQSSLSIIERNHTCPACSSISENKSILKGKRAIQPTLNEFTSCSDKSFTTSEPILVSYRCSNCHPSDNEATIVFKKASDFDATITKCVHCGMDTVVVEIKDSFEISNFDRQFKGMDFPCKFLRYDSDIQTIVIELE